MAHAITVNRKQVLLVVKIPDLYLKSFYNYQLIVTMPTKVRSPDTQTYAVRAD